ncbi:hypothetical protein MACH16_09820 [Marinomonas pontica]|uniref:Uncharacterized protein n=1 Tax=Marinomonas pontica TaxID=264739 RepID=A0ABN6WL82_9GAMM|nr:hypothetical protein MACH16_09820 [Marinomonas pontica]
MSFGLEVMVRSALSHIGDLIAVSLGDFFIFFQTKCAKYDYSKQAN